MKESMWGYLIIALGVVIIAILIFVQRLTTFSEEDYHLSREIMKASMLDAVDYGTYMKTGKLVMSKEKFVAVFTRRFAESVTPDKTYTLNFYDIHEYPPKATIRINTTTGETSINGNGIDLDLNTFISAILITSEADGIIKISIDEKNGNINNDKDKTGKGIVNPKDIYAGLKCVNDIILNKKSASNSANCKNINASMLASLGGDSKTIELEDIVMLEQGIMAGHYLGDINQDGKVDSNDVTYIQKMGSSKELDEFQKIIGDINRDGKVDKYDAKALSDMIENGRATIKDGDVNGDGMITAADAYLLEEESKSNIVLTDEQKHNANKSKILKYYAKYLTCVFDGECKDLSY